jgi:hypothetical protein
MKVTHVTKILHGYDVRAVLNTPESVKIPRRPEAAQCHVRLFGRSAFLMILDHTGLAGYS